MTRLIDLWCWDPELGSRSHYINLQHTPVKMPGTYQDELFDKFRVLIVFIELNLLVIYTSLQYHWRVGRNTICKFILKVCKAILEEFQEEYLICPTAPEEWRRVEEKFRNRWNVPHAAGALDVKHIAMKKTKKSGSEYFN